jgi:hypothetical protein
MAAYADQPPATLRPLAVAHRRAAGQGTPIRRRPDFQPLAGGFRGQGSVNRSARQGGGSGLVGYGAKNTHPSAAVQVYPRFSFP